MFVKAGLFHQSFAACGEKAVRSRGFFWQVVGTKREFQDKQSIVRLAANDEAFSPSAAPEQLTHLVRVALPVADSIARSHPKPGSARSYPADRVVARAQRSVSAYSRAVPFPDAGHGPYRILRLLNRGAVLSFNRSLAAPETAQSNRFEFVRRGAAGTAFGRDHALTDRMPLTAWREAVPIRKHAEYLPWLDRIEGGESGVLTTERVLQLVQTSGTTGKPKRLPVTATWAASVGAAQRLWVLGLLRDDEELAGGSALSIVSPAVGEHTPGGLGVGSNTGRMFLAQPWWIRWRAPVPYDVYCISEIETRQYAILRHALAADVRSWTAANPSSVLLYARRLREWWDELVRDLADGTLARLGQRGLARRSLGNEPIFPWNLRRINCWRGGPAAFFANRIPAALGRDVPMREAGVTASEGFFAVPVDDGDPVAWMDGHLLEFIGEDGQPRWAWEVEVGHEYRLVVSTEAGLYRYDLGDIVRITGFFDRTPRMVYVRRAGNELSAVGERVTESQVLAAVASLPGNILAVSASIGWSEVPCLRFALASSGLLDVAATALMLDATLRRENIEYDDRRATGRYAPPTVAVVSLSAFDRWRSARVAEGAAEAQVKDPIVLASERWDALVEGG